MAAAGATAVATATVSLNHPDSQEAVMAAAGATAGATATVSKNQPSLRSGAS